MNIRTYVHARSYEHTFIHIRTYVPVPVTYVCFHGNSRISNSCLPQSYSMYYFSLLLLWQPFIFIVSMATSLPIPSGAYYSGMWSANQKHGRGTLVLQNGSTLHCLFHHDVLVSSSHDPEGVSADHRTLPLRTKTPLTTLIGG